MAYGLNNVPWQAVNRYCAGGLTAVANAAGSINSGMDEVIIPGGVSTNSTSPRPVWRVIGTEETETRLPPTFPNREDAADDTTLSVGWNIAQKHNLARERMEAWAVRPHERASGANDDAAALTLTLTTAENASALGLTSLGTIKAWASVGVDPKFTGDGSLIVIDRLLKRAGLKLSDVNLWEINEAFASVPVSVCQESGLDEDRQHLRQRL